MRRTARTGDDRTNAARVRFFGVVKHIIRHAVCGDDFGLKRHAELRQHVGGLLHDRPVGVAAHKDADHHGNIGGCCIHMIPLSRTRDKGAYHAPPCTFTLILPNRVR